MSKFEGAGSVIYLLLNYVSKVGADIYVLDIVPWSWVLLTRFIARTLIMLGWTLIGSNALDVDRVIFRYGNFDDFELVKILYYTVSQFS